ncbi:cytidylyltransferase-domain-containing protein [Glomus cerebriforme]|uniref:Cytidylyltransferase-domain-containing protein n=1 Tax=Glomus cerebriforme TaxID=658196 RepID=A0A397TQB9_9GLOM|nr:cytidylyltransferase-domain-containing protein [Glomus cerebriforme]
MINKLLKNLFCKRNFFFKRSKMSSYNSESHLTPVTKLLTNLSYLKSQSPSTTFIVLLTTGSMNPIHIQHYRNFEIAKRELESRLSVKVIAGYISPSQDLYVFSKLGKYAIPIDKRIEMCKLAVNESNWIDVDLWESKSIRSCLEFIHFWEVLYRLSKFLNEHEEINCNIKVFYLCGSDHFMNTGVSRAVLRHHGLVVIGRKKDNSWIENTENKLDRIFGKDAWKESVVLYSLNRQD